jgi:hypothetical protein
MGIRYCESTKYQVPSTKYQVQCTKYNVPSTFKTLIVVGCQKPKLPSFSAWRLGAQKKELQNEQVSSAVVRSRR